MGNILDALRNPVAMSKKDKEFFEKEIGLKIGRLMGRGAFGVVFEAEFTDEVKGLVKVAEEEPELELHPGPKKGKEKKKASPQKPAPEPKAQTQVPGEENIPLLTKDEQKGQQAPEVFDRSKLSAAEARAQNVGDWISKYEHMVGKKVALKWLRYDEEHEAMVRAEAEAMDQLQHPNIIDIRTAIWCGKWRRMAIVMELSPFGSLHSWAGKRPKKLSGEQFLRFGTGVIDALKTIHRSGRVHGDLHGGNILIFPDPERPDDPTSVIGKISDFGLVRDINSYFIDPRDKSKWLEGPEREKAAERFLSAVETDKFDIKNMLRQMMNNPAIGVVNVMRDYKDVYHYHKQMLKAIDDYDVKDLIQGVPHGVREIGDRGTFLEAAYASSG